MDTETVAVTETVEQPVEQVQEELVNDTEAFESPEVEQQEEPVKEQSVPLSAHIKERKKRQEAEQEVRMYREHQLKLMQKEQQVEEEDETQYEPITKADMSKREAAILRKVEESSWIRHNPEKAEIINEKLEKFLKRRPNLTAAIDAAPNRYEQAWEFMEMYENKQRAVNKQQKVEKKAAPNSPSGVPKGAAMDQSIDVMNMTDEEFANWRRSKKSRR